MKSSLSKPVFLSVAMLLGLYAQRTSKAAIEVVTTNGQVYKQNFNGLSSTATSAWVDDATIASWFTSRPSYRVGPVSGNLDSLFSFGSAGDSDRALGSAIINSEAIAYGILFRNTSGFDISSISVAYYGEQWRRGFNPPQSNQTLDFFYDTASSDPTSAFDLATAPNNWTAHDALDFTTKFDPTDTSVLVLDGNIENTNRFSISSTITLTVPSGEWVWLGWRDTNSTGNDHGVSIDDLTVTFSLRQPEVVPEAGTLVAFGGLLGLYGLVKYRHGKAKAAAP